MAGRAVDSCREDIAEEEDCIGELCEIDLDAKGERKGLFSAGFALFDDFEGMGR